MEWVEGPGLAGKGVCRVVLGPDARVLRDRARATEDAAARGDRGGGTAVGPRVKVVVGATLLLAAGYSAAAIAAS
ncbi:MAG TPA: hypothetical protein VH044_00745 [Polyangiaceae bacterium]|nr:hypothetical protein [Polyangiaceae bacterium]